MSLQASTVYDSLPPFIEHVRDVTVARTTGRNLRVPPTWGSGVAEPIRIEVLDKQTQHDAS